MSELRPVQARISADARADVSMPADRWLEEHHAYLRLMIDLAEKGRTAFDVIHNNCLGGRIVPEKGPDLAILAAREAGLPLDLVGPVLDPRYFATCVKPLLGGAVRYLGHLTHDQLATQLGRASACLVTPRWEEPYCLAAAEALACGTPVAGFARGALPDLLDERCAVLATPDDVGELAAGLRGGTVVTIRRAGACRRALRRRSNGRPVRGPLP